MNTLIRLADRKGFLKGHLNTLQHEALQWLMIEESTELFDIERERMKYTILAANPSLFDSLYGEEKVEANVEWITPRTAEEFARVEEFLASTFVGGTEP